MTSTGCFSGLQTSAIKRWPSLEIQELSDPLIEYLPGLLQCFCEGGLARNERGELIKVGRHEFAIRDETSDRPDGFVA
jgi:hypothetical protein